MSEEVSKDNLDLYYKNIRKKYKIKLALFCLIIFLISLIPFTIYNIINRKHYIDYTENADLGYKVNLLENEFYEETTLTEGADIIASLIKDIEIEFKYDLEFSESMKYKYDYKILAEIELKEKSKTSQIYQAKQEVITKKELAGNTKEIEITEKVVLDYNEYNNLIKRLIEQYGLSNTDSKLLVSLYVNVINEDTEEKINTQDNVMALEIPLNSKTIELAKNENVKNKEKQIVIDLHNTENAGFFMGLGIIILVVGFVILGVLVKYHFKTRSAEKMYEAELKKILFDYKNYIQKIDSKIDYENYKIIKIESFKKLLGIREDFKSPILMKTEEKNNKTIFMIMHNEMLYVYILGVKEIRNRLIKESKEKNEKKESNNK